MNNTEVEKMVSNYHTEIDELRALLATKDARIRELESALSESNHWRQENWNKVKELESWCAQAKELFDEIWEEDEMGWLIEPETESKTEECVGCGAILPHGHHLEDCLQGKIHKLLSTEAGKSILDQLATLKLDLDEANHWRERHCKDAEAYGKQSAENWQKCRDLEAACAVKTGVLRAFRHSMDTDKPFPSVEKLNEAIADDAGIPILTRLDEAKWLLSNCRWQRYEENREWFERREKWLGGGVE